MKNQTRLLLTVGLTGCLVWPALTLFRQPMSDVIKPEPATSARPGSGGQENAPVQLQLTQARENLEQTSDGQSLMAQRGMSASLASASARPLHENHLGGRSSDFNQWLDSPLGSTTASPGISDLMASVRARSTARVEEPQRESDNGEENETRADHPDEAMRFRNLQLQDENREIPLDGLEKAREQMNVMRAAQQRRDEAAGKPDGIEVAGIDPGSWAWLGPGNIGGRIRTIVIDPVNPDNMWVGSVSGGIWKTTNAGASWQPVNDFLANLAVSTMVIDPTNPNIMYAGTGEGLFSNVETGLFTDAVRGDGIFKTTDGGVTWNQLSNTNPGAPTICLPPATLTNCSWLYVNRLAISPDGSTILAATSNGVQRSTDGGTTWNPTPSFAGNIQDIDFDPTDSSKAIAATNLPAAARYSTNGGQTWMSAAFNPANPSPNPAGGANRIELAYAPSNPSTVYALVDEQNAPSVPPTPPTIQGVIYKSSNGGGSYTKLANTIVNPAGNTLLGNQGGYANIIWVNPLDENFVVLGGLDLYRSTDGGGNFTQVSQWQNAPASSAHADHHMIVASSAFNNTTNKTVYFGNDGGIYRADDISTVSLTSGWVNLNNNLGITQFYGAAANSAGVIVGGAQDNGNPRFNGDQNSWMPIPGMGGDGGYVAADPTDTNYFYGEYVNLQIRRTTDGGASGGDIFTGISDAVCTPPPGGTCTPPANFIAPFVLDPNEPNRMLAGGLSLWRSNDIKAAGLPTWAAIKPPASNGFRPPTNIPISAITVSPNNPDFIVVGHNDGQMYLTLDGTGTNPPQANQCSGGFSPCWSRINVPGTTPARFVTRVVVDKTRSPNWIYATFGGFSNNNVYVTKDLGSTWIDVSGVTGSTTDLPSVPVRSLVINPVRSDFMYVGTDVGVFASEDAGATWHLPQDGPANVSVDELFWLNGNLVAVTHGRGLFKTSTPIYASPRCVPPIPACSCFGEWNCPCSWNIQRVPTVNDDIAIGCNMHLGPGLPGGIGQARNMRVDGVLTMDVDLAVTDNITNVGNIRRSSPGIQSSLSCRNLSNSRPPGATLAGVISLLGGISASGNVTNAGIIALGTRLDSNDLTTTAASTLTTDILNVRGNLENSGRTEALGTGGITVKGNVVNGGFLKAPALVLAANIAGQYDFSGSGVWQFTNFGIPAVNGLGGPAPTVSLGSNVTFDITNFSNNGKLDFRDKTLNFRGDSFQGNGTTLGTGTLGFAPTSGNSIFNANGPSVTIASGTVEYQSGGTINGPLTIDNGATLAMNTGGSLTANKDVTVNGTLSKIGGGPVFIFNGQTFTNNGIVGDIDFITFDDGAGPPVQFIAGTGSWSPRNIQIGVAGSPTTVNLNNSVAFASNQLVTAAGSSLNVGNFTLTLTGPMNFFSGKISGTGLLKMQPVSGSPRLGNPFVALTIDPALEIASGTVRATSLITNGKLTIDPGATLSPLGSVGVEARGDVENNGTLNAFSDGPSFKFKGGTFTNNGVVTGNVYVNFGDFFGPPLVQNLAGTGSWAGSPRLLIDSTSTTTLLNDFNYNGGNLWVEGRLNTGAFTLSLPCAVTWSGAGDVVGNVRRTNLAACPGAAIAFGSPFTTIQFTSGTPPTEITVNVLLAAPAGFLNAAKRTYLITPTGGSGYTATLRLHYLDSELNGNAESMLQLWRNNGSNWTPQGATNRNTTENWVEYAGVTQFSPWTISGPTVPTVAPAIISGRITTPDGSPLAGVTMNLSGARTAKVITDGNGNYRFNNVDTDNFYTVTPSILNYHFSPESSSFSLLANKTDAVFTATRDAVIRGNVIDTADYFVRQHYLDFLGREPDERGFNFWSDQILSCGGDAACIERRTINVSAAYFLSIEFHETGGLVDGLYRASYGRRPMYAEFMPDARTVAQNVIVGHADWAQQLAANKQAFVAAWVERPDFRAAYDGLGSAAFVDTLIAHTRAGFNGDRDALVGGLINGTLSRAAVLRQVVENEGFTRAKSNQMFVMMEYFGYLRRDPDESGYQFWLNKLNQFNGNFVNADMVKAFITSGEYRQRFGP